MASRRTRCRPGTGCHDQHVTVAQLGDERVEVPEVVGVVGVADDDESAPSRLDTARDRRPVTTTVDLHDASAGGFGELRGAVVGAVVRDQHLATDAGSIEPAEGRGDARLDGLGLVQARHEHRDLEHCPPPRHHVDRRPTRDGSAAPTRVMAPPR
jgi:hypothetical protein